MSDLAGARKIIQVEETQFQFAVSESFAQKMGQAMNFLSMYQHSEKQFFINGNFSRVALPFVGIDGLTFFQFDAFIIDVWMFVQNAGSGGTTELDLRLATSSGGAFSTIFSTTPKITSAAGDYAFIHVGSAVANTTAPVLSTTNVTAGSALRCHIIDAQTGTAVNGAGIVVHYRPR